MTTMSFCKVLKNQSAIITITILVVGNYYINYLRAAAPAADPGQKKRWTWCCRRSSRNSRHPRTQLVCFFLEFQEVWLWPAYWGLLNKYLLMKGSRWHSLHCLNTWQNNWSIVQVASPPRSLLGFVISFSPSPKPLRVKSPWKQLLGSTSDAIQHIHSHRYPLNYNVAPPQL